MDEQKWEKIFNKMKVGLMLKGAIFLANIVFSLKHKLSEEVPTAGTDGREFVYNPDFMDKLSESKRIGLLAHEAGHIMFMHPLRLGNNNPIIYNMAADYVVNLYLHKAGYDLPDGALLDSKYEDWSTIQVYDDLITNAVEVPAGYIGDLIPLGSGNGEEGLSEEALERAQQNLEKELASVLVKAKILSQSDNEDWGNIPGEVSRTIEELTNPKLNWDVLLHRFMEKHLREDFNWRRPNRRFQPDQLYLPSRESTGIKNITIFFDVSGSVDDEQLERMLSEGEYIWHKYKPDKLVLGCFDTRIRNVYNIPEIPAEGIKDLVLKGGGGTNFKPVFTYCEENTPSLLLIFTDLYASPIKEDPGYPVLWICNSDAKPAMIGETIYYTE